MLDDLERGDRFVVSGIVCSVSKSAETKFDPVTLPISKPWEGPSLQGEPPPLLNHALRKIRNSSPTF